MSRRWILFSDAEFAALCYSKESRMNGQYQQPTDSLNNDNKYVGFRGLWGFLDSVGGSPCLPWQGGYVENSTSRSPFSCGH